MGKFKVTPGCEMLAQSATEAIWGVEAVAEMYIPQSPNYVNFAATIRLFAAT